MRPFSRLAGVGCLLVACGTPVPLPPEIDTSGMEPAVARAFESARTAIVDQPDSGARWGRLGMVADAHEEDLFSNLHHPPSFDPLL